MVSLAWINGLMGARLTTSACGADRSAAAGRGSYNCNRQCLRLRQWVLCGNTACNCPGLMNVVFNARPLSWIEIGGKSNT